MKRYHRTDKIDGIDLAAIYAAYAAPSSLKISGNFKNTMVKAGLPIEPLDNDHPFGFSFGGTPVDTATVQPGIAVSTVEPNYLVKGERRIDKGYVILNCHYDPGHLDKTLIVAAQGMHIDVTSLNEILDSFTQKTDLEEIDIPEPLLEMLQTVDFQWARRLQELQQHH